MPIYLETGPEKIALYERLQLGDAPPLIRFLDPFKYISGVGYSAATLVYLRQHRRRVEESYSTTERVNLRWLIWLSGAAAAVWLMTVLGSVYDFTLKPLRPRSDDLAALAVTVLVYAIGYMGLRRPEIFRFERLAPTEPEPVEKPEVRYARSGLGATEASTLKTSLLMLMTSERPYRDPDLTLPYWPSG